MKWSLIGASSVMLLMACGAAQEKRLADGSWQIRCGEAMNRCATRADVLCGDRGYQVLGGSTHGRVLGGSNSSYRARVGESELTVRCGPAVLDGPPLPSPRPDEGVSAAKESAPLCVPGSTQACVGPGGCSGGQACLPEGSGYDSCDCGQVQVAPADAPRAPTGEPVDRGPSSSGSDL